MEGETVTLRCEATGYPQPKVYWKREGKGQKIVILDRNTGRKKEGTSRDTKLLHTKRKT